MAGRNSNGEGSIYQRKDSDGNPVPNKWVSQIEIDGKRHTFVGKNRLEVYEKLRRFKAQPKAPPEMNYGEFLGLWLDMKSRQIKASSFDRLECTVRNNVLPYVGNRRLSDLNYDVLQQIINQMRDEGKAYSTVKKAYDALNASIRFAEFPCELILKNPMRGVTVPPRHLFNTKESRSLTEDEIARLREAALEKWGNGKAIYPLGQAIIFILNTGIRAGEAIALNWNDYNEDDALLSVHETIKKVRDRQQGEHVWKHQRQNTKTAHGYRWIPLNREAQKALKDIKQERYFGQDSPIFAQRDGTPNTMDNFARTFERIAKRAGITGCGLHTLRHTFATQMLAKGTDIKVVSSILGHASIGITYNLYVHILDEMTAQAIEISDI